MRPEDRWRGWVRLSMGLALGAALAGAAGLARGASGPAASPRPTSAGAAARYRALPVAPEILFTPRDERSVSFTADERTAFFTVRLAAEGYLQVICTSTLREGHWSEPQVLPFSGGPAFDADPFVTADGKTLYFASSRSPEGGETPVLDLWVAERDGAGWKPPRPLAGKARGKGSARSPVLGRSGRLYFSSTRDGSNKLYYADPTAGGFGEAVPLGEGLNGAGEAVGLAVDPAEDTLVFAALGGADELLAPGQVYPRGDLYVSHKTSGVWSPARRLGEPINSAAAEGSPSFSSDGHWLYFMSERGFATRQDIVLTYDALERGLATSLNGRGNIYRIDARVLEAYR